MRIMEFEWDENKNQINIKKYGISFKYAARVFDDEHYFEQYDEYHSDDEDRYNIIGMVDEISSAHEVCHPPKTLRSKLYKKMLSKN